MVDWLKIEGQQSILTKQQEGKIFPHSVLLLAAHYIECTNIYTLWTWIYPLINANKAASFSARIRRAFSMGVSIIVGMFKLHNQRRIHYLPLLAMNSVKRFLQQVV